VLNLGTGEGDYDRMLASFSNDVLAVDINEEDIAYARELNRDVPNLRYEQANALELPYEDNTFDLVVSCEVLEHVGDPESMVLEIRRVLKPDGVAIMTFPSREFPVTYDPINRFWQFVRPRRSNEKLVSQGAYAFGHDYLIGSSDFKWWVKRHGLKLLEFNNLSGHLVGLLEMYWTGIAQRLFKKNAENLATATAGPAVSLRPTSTKEPALVFVTDALLALDRKLFGRSRRSIGKGVVFRKSEHTF
jgi:SAM-dependent methyltransferase